MTRRCARTALTLALTLTIGCGRKPLSPEPVPVDRVECARCGMLISSQSGGGEIVAAGEDTRFYDDVGCLAARPRRRGPSARRSTSDWPATRSSRRRRRSTRGPPTRGRRWAPASSRSGRRTEARAADRVGTRARLERRAAGERPTMTTHLLTIARLEFVSAARLRWIRLLAAAFALLGHGRRVRGRRGRRAVGARRLRAHDDGARAGGAGARAAGGAGARRVRSVAGAGHRAVSVRPADRARDGDCRALAGGSRRARGRDRDWTGIGRRHRRVRRGRRRASRATPCFVAASVALGTIFLSIAAAVAAATEKRVAALGVGHVRLVLLRAAVRRRGALAGRLADRIDRRPRAVRVGVRQSLPISSACSRCRLRARRMCWAPPATPGAASSADRSGDRHPRRRWRWRRGRSRRSVSRSR